MHFYKRNIGDYAKKAGKLTMIQHGAYTLLLDAYYDREHAPTLQEAIEWCWAETDEEVNAIKVVLRKFFVEIDGLFHQKHADEKIGKYHAKCQTNRISGQKGGRPKTISVTNDNHLITVAGLTTNHQPLTTNHKKTKNLCPADAAQISVQMVEKDKSDTQDTPANELVSITSNKNDPARAILGYLNKKTGRAYKPVKANLEMIVARLKEYSYDDLIGVVDRKCGEWLTNEKMFMYLRPATLFNASKCAQYVGERAIPLTVTANKPWYLINKQIEAKGKERDMDWLQESEQWPIYRDKVLRSYGITSDVYQSSLIEWSPKK